MNANGAGFALYGMLISLLAIVFGLFSEAQTVFQTCLEEMKQGGQSEYWTRYLKYESGKESYIGSPWLGSKVDR